MLGQLESGGRAVIADMEAGLGTLTRLPAGSLDRVLLVVNPAIKSVDVARRAMGLITERNIAPSPLVVLNRMRGPGDLDEVRSVLNGAELMTVPEDPEIRRADVEGRAPIDVAPDSPAVEALLTLARSWAAQQR